MEKCVYEVKSIPFLGYIVSGSGLEMDPEKLQAIQEWPIPVNLKGIQRFQGFANYYRKYLQVEVTALRSKVRDLEDRSRRNNVKIRGILESVSNSYLREYVTDLFTKLLPTVTITDFLLDRIHRLPKA
ncbi:uncharacterized protein LOC134949748 [Pseudophryne corroboree]|uniref:uncharacterized protein LOC134949748 n=1 Tax=Pseudophryne corroboree TaxID=495146 RepID=UPI0030819EDD